MITFYASCNHIDPRYAVTNSPFQVSPDGDKFYAKHPLYGCSRSCATAEAAVRLLMTNYACTNIVITKPLVWHIKWKLIDSDAFEQSFEASSEAHAIERWADFWGITQSACEYFNINHI